MGHCLFTIGSLEAAISFPGIAALSSHFAWQMWERKICRCLPHGSGRGIMVTCRPRVSSCHPPARIRYRNSITNAPMLFRAMPLYIITAHWGPAMASVAIFDILGSIEHIEVYDWLNARLPSEIIVFLS